MASSSSPPSPSASKDWSATQYLKFGDQRTRAVHELVSRVPLPGGQFPIKEASSALSAIHIVDLGCGPGNSTAVLASRFPGAQLSGVDSSPNMLERARETLPGVPFALGDVRTFSSSGEKDTSSSPPNLLLANAVFQWLPLKDRLPTIVRLLGKGLASGGVLAYQVPDNKEEPSHRAMREVARGQVPGTEDGVWVPYLRDLVDRDPIETPEQIYDALQPHSAAVDIWHTAYHHVLPGGPHDIVEWVKGTGLRPFVQALPEGAVREAYLAAYEARLAELYPRRVDGSVLLKYPRLFVVAVRKD